MLDPKLADELKQWKKILFEELSAHLAVLREDTDIYGFALELPEDLSNMGIISAIGRESALDGEQPNSRMWLCRRYGSGEWEYVPNGKTFPETCNKLEAIGETYSEAFVDDATFEYTPGGEAFVGALYTTCLETMEECDERGLFGSIWFKLLSLSDAEHPIVTESFYRLNQGRALQEAAQLYPRG